MQGTESFSTAFYLAAALAILGALALVFFVKPIKTAKDKKIQPYSQASQ